MQRLLLLLALVLPGCPLTGPVDGPPPNPPPDTDLCIKMCEHIGPTGLKCEEGQPVYNNDLPGPANVPNQSCAENCKELQTKGFFVNPRCVATVPSCDKIEDYRQKAVDACQLP
jgi:hypothetical protein